MNKQPLTPAALDTMAEAYLVAEGAKAMIASLSPRINPADLPPLTEPMIEGMVKAGMTEEDARERMAMVIARAEEIRAERDRLLHSPAAGRA